MAVSAKLMFCSGIIILAGCKRTYFSRHIFTRRYTRRRLSEEGLRPKGRSRRACVHKVINLTRGDIT